MGVQMGTVRESMGTFQISCAKLRKNQKRAKFDDVVREIWGQMDDLGHDLDNAILIGPKGATHRQVLLALKKIEEMAEVKP